MLPELFLTVFFAALLVSLASLLPLTLRRPRRPRSSKPLGQDWLVPPLVRMGRLTPDRPRQAGETFQCSYCGRWGQPGSCEGCGAPNAPAEGAARPDGFLTVPDGRAKLKPPAFEQVLW